MNKLLLFCAVLLCAPAALLALWPTAHPVELLDINQRQSYYKLDEKDRALISSQNNSLSAAQLETASEYVHYKKYPPRLVDYLKAEETKPYLKQYKAYAVAGWNEGNAASGRILVWVPRSENLHMPADLQPLTDAGFFVVYNPNNSRGISLLQGAPGKQADPAQYTARATAEKVGTMVIAYGPADGDVTEFYLYEIYSKELAIDGTPLLANLRKETAALKYKKHRFYLGHGQASATKLFREEQLSKKEAKRAEARGGGNCDEKGYTQFALLNPQHPSHGIQSSTADMSQFITKPSETSGYIAPTVKMVACSKCNGKGSVEHVTSFDDTRANAYYDSKGNLKTETVKTGTRSYKSQVRCPVCNGEGKVPE